ncbi:MAG: hypothetical protein ACRCZB_05365 [Bacteroidales bacterium]
MSSVDIEFPDDDVYNVAMARISMSSNSSSYGKNPFINQNIRNRITTYNSYGKTPSGRDPYFSQSLAISEQAESQSYINFTKAGNLNIDIENRRIWGFSNVQGSLIVNWAKFSRSWSKVRFEHESDVIDVAKMFILRYVGDLRSQSDPNTGVTADGSGFLDRANSIEDSIVKEKWKSRIPLIVMH